MTGRVRADCGMGVEYAPPNCTHYRRWARLRPRVVMVYYTLDDEGEVAKMWPLDYECRDCGQLQWGL